MCKIKWNSLYYLVRSSEKKTKLKNCSAETVYKLSKLFNVTMEELLQDSVENRLDFEIFKSNVCHRVKDTNEFDFIIETLQSNDIEKYWKMKWYPETFYLLAMVDYLSRINDIPLCTKYDDIRPQSLKRTIYPRDVIMAAKLHPSLDIREKCRQESIPEFARFNIIESEIRNVY